MTGRRDVRFPRFLARNILFTLVAHRRQCAKRIHLDRRPCAAILALLSLVLFMMAFESNDYGNYSY